MAKESNEFKDIDKFLEWYKSKRPETVYLIKNKERFEAIFNCMATISKYIEKTSPDAKFNVSHGELNETAIYFEATAEDFVFRDIKGFCAALSESSNIEFYPLTNGKIKMGIVFNDAYDFAPPYEEIHKNDK